MTHAYADQFTSVAGNGGGSGPAWLLPRRRAALDRFTALGFPTMRNEDWHFTSVAPIADREFRPAEHGAVPVESLSANDIGEPTWHRRVFVNGRPAPALASATALPAGVEVRDLGRAWRHDEALIAHLTRVAPFDENAFTALNTAFMSDGAVIRVAAGVTVDEPIHVMYVTAHGADGRVVYPRTLIVLGANAECTVVESFVAASDGAYFTNAVTEAVLEDGARLEHIKVQRESTAAYHVGTMQVHQARDSHLVSFSFASGAALSRTNIYTVLDGPGAGATLNGLYLASGTQHVDHQTRIEHAEPNCFSREVYKGILDGASHAVFNGKVFVRPIAQKTDGKQTNNNLLLSDRARVDTKPQLEIFADDVKCTHGATVGRLDALALFYLTSRGIGADLARKLLTYAFAADALEQIGIATVREKLEALVLERFAG